MISSGQLIITQTYSIHMHFVKCYFASRFLGNHDILHTENMYKTVFNKKI